MAFLDDIDRKLSQFGKSAIKKTKDVSDSMKLSSAIQTEEQNQEEVYKKIGRYIYENYAEKIDNQIKEWCIQIQDSNEQILKYKEQISMLKGTVICPSCGASIQADSRFCNVCGQQIEVNNAGMRTNQKRRCTLCGCELDADAIFCTNCGTKIESGQSPDKGQSEADAKKVCPGCGRETRPGEVFCIKCGTSLK